MIGDMFSFSHSGSVQFDLILIFKKKAILKKKSIQFIMRGTRREKKRRNQRNTANCPHYRCHAHFLSPNRIVWPRLVSLCLCVYLWRKCSPNLTFRRFRCPCEHSSLFALSHWWPDRKKYMKPFVINCADLFLLLWSTTGPIKWRRITGTLAADSKSKNENKLPPLQGWTFTRGHLESPCRIQTKEKGNDGYHFFA